MERGVLGGSFDPIHVGHVRLAQEAMEALGLAEVWLIPAHHQPLKDSVQACAEDRLEMCRLAAEDCPGLRVCGIETHRVGPSYTVETVDALVRSHPGSRWTFIAGTDALVTLPHWREPQRLVSLCRAVAVERGGVSWHSLSDSLPETLCRGVHFLHLDVLPLSSSDVRNLMRRQEPITGKVPVAVEQYIRAHNLYGQVSG